jgi:hypothetical protein
MFDQFVNLIIMHSNTQLLLSLSDSTQPNVEKANELDKCALSILTQEFLGFCTQQGFRIGYSGSCAWRMVLKRLFTVKYEFGAWLIALARHPSDGCC